MRIGNRINMTITRARMTRLAKSRIYTNQRTSTRKNTNSNKANPSLAELLNSINNKNQTTSGEKLLVNRTQTLMYSGMETAANRLKGHTEKFLETGEKSLFEQPDSEAAKKESMKEIKAFVSDYNLMMGRLNQSADNVDKAYAKKMQSTVQEYSVVLRKLGITQSGSGILNLDEKKLKEAELSDMKRVFGDAEGFSKKVGELGTSISDWAKGQLTELKKDSYLTSVSYNRYGQTAENSSGSSYNSKA